MFSTDLLKFQHVNQTEDDHHEGTLVTFNNKLTAIGGKTYRVEALENESRQWNSSIIDSTPQKFINRPAVVVTESGSETMFIFGKLNSIIK